MQSARELTVDSAPESVATREHKVVREVRLASPRAAAGSDSVQPPLERHTDSASLCATVSEDLVAVHEVVHGGDAEHAQLAAVTVLAHRLGLEHAVVGRVRSGKAHIDAISDVALSGERTTLLDGVLEAMAEAVRESKQRAGEPMRLQRGPAHLELARRMGSRDAASVVFSLAEGVTGVVTLLPRHDMVLDGPLSERAQIAVLSLAPAMAIRMRQRTSGALSRLRAKAWRWRAFLLIAFGALLVWAAMGQAAYRIHASALIEGLEQRAVVAPFDGFIATASVRAGERVRKRQVLAKLNTRELELEAAELSGDYNALKSQQRQALARGERSEARILEARLAQAQAQRERASALLARAQLTSPIDGVVLSGDLSRMIGAPVVRGDVLFEVAPGDQFRLALRVDERDLTHVSQGVRGEVTLVARPNHPLPFEVTRTTSVAEMEKGRHVFLVEAHLLSELPDLRAGLEGVARIDAGQQARIWIWTHRLTDWARVQLRRLWP